MCGIIGAVSKAQFSVNDVVLKALKRLEYRGYDSWGYAIREGMVYKIVGGIDDFPKDLETSAAISHTRWATHGGVTEKNAHPHFNNDRTIMAVHNGIIENYEELKTRLEKSGYLFNTETDSEIIPNYFDLKLNKEKRTMKEAMFHFFDDAKGAFAIIILRKDDDNLYALKRDSPLCLGIGSDKWMLASDAYAFSDFTNKAIFFEDDEFAIISPEDYIFFDSQGREIKKDISEFSLSRDEESMEHYAHYMIKEIKEEPKVARRLIQSFSTIQKDCLGRFAKEIKKAKKVVFVSCGTSYHASLVGASLFHGLGIDAQAVIASEFSNFVHIDKETLVIAVSQSGETMDVVMVLKQALKKGASILSVVNVPYSTIQRLSKASLEILAGQEICVASTKAFTNQLIVLYALAICLGYEGIDLEKIPAKIEKTLQDNETKIKKLAKELKEKEHIFILGRGPSYPIAREFALKLKEISYIHAEGMMAGELKHGTIALVEEGTPIFSLIPNDNADMISNTREVQARGAKTYVVSNIKKGDFLVPGSSDAEFGIYAAMIGHLLSYHIAKQKDLPIDKPRNLAKSVTVK